MRAPCKICGKPSVGFQMCRTHYTRWREHGTTDDPTPTQKQRFDKYWQVDSETGCWNWTGWINKFGRPIAYKPYNKKIHAYRLSYELHVGPIPEGLYVCHKCDNPKCVNPDHLWVGTQMENIHDSMSKGRFIRGEKQGLSKLTEDAVRDIRTHKAPQSVFMKKYGVSSSQICRVRNRKDWAWVE